MKTCRTMNKRVVQVDDHRLVITCDAPELWPVITFSFLSADRDDEAQPVDLALDIHGGYGTPFAGYELRSGQEGDRIFFRRADYLLTIDAAFRTAAIRANEPISLKHALLNLYSSYLIHLNQGLLFHASCVIDHGQAHLFAGQSGVGKSTVALLSFPRKLLADEAALIKFTKDGAMAYNSPFRSELTAKYGGDPTPVTSVQLLHQSSKIRRERLNKGDALLKLYDTLFFWQHRKEESTRILRLLKRFVDQVPVYDLYFQKNDRFWPLISVHG
ncbi:MAG: hypothetical protein LKI94_02680 [Sporolactobacillus sp.]|nr:hypothetical protein [Sporolactobacillus sp.]